MRDDRLAPVLVVALLLTTGVGAYLWTAGLPAGSTENRISPATDPFPLVAPSTRLHVLPVPLGANTSERLTLLSIQGLANRDRADLYLDFANESGNATSILTFLAARYGVSLDFVTEDWVYVHYLPTLTGLVVYDPAHPESVNVVTMLAGIRDAAIAGPDMAAFLHDRFALPILFDYGSSDWAALDPAGATDRALQELYPSCNPNLLAILPPGRMLLRDYLISTRTFVFYQPQGVLASPGELASTQRVLAATPRGIPILGWFDNPTLTEENAFIQLASAAGKAVVGSQDTADLSVLTGYGRNVVRSQPAPPAAPPLEDKTYAVLAVPDGDNLDFVTSRMRTLWAEPERGSLPLAWSVSPILADLAPPYMDYLYATASAEDRFVMAPSGAGYVYPDYFGPEDLAPYLQVTSRYAADTGMDVPWLLNAFVASEIPYSSATLSAYVGALHPRGIVLDYDDQAKTQDVWMQAGGATAAPVIRSTQAWTSMDNLYAKVGAASAGWGTGPHFLWITLYTFRFDLGDGVRMVQELENRTSGGVVLVTPEQLFSLMEQDFATRARAELASARSDPLASVLFAPRLAAAQAYLDASASATDPGLAALGAYLASSTLRDVGFQEALVAFGLAVVLAALANLRPGIRAGRFAQGWPREAPALLVVAAASGLFMLALRVALTANFWSYQWVLLGSILAGFGRPLRRYLSRPARRGSLAVLAGVDLVFVALAFLTNVAFGLAAIGTVALADAILERHPVRPASLVLALSVGSAVGFLLTPDAVALGGLALAVVAPLAVLRNGVPTAPSRPVRGGFLRGPVLALPLAALVVSSTYSLSLRLGLAGPQLAPFAAALLVLGPLAGLLAARPWIDRWTRPVQIVAFVGAGALSLGAAFSAGVIATGLVLFGCIACLAIGAEATLRTHTAADGELGAVVAGAFAWIPIALILFRMPPVVYSLTLVHFPEPVEALLYAPELVLAVVAAVLALLAVVRLRRAGHVGKGYPADEALRGGRSP